MQRALARKLLGTLPQRQLQAHFKAHLPHFKQPASKAAWQRRGDKIRRDMLASFFRGHPDGLLDLPPNIEWTDTIETNHGYRIRKLRYEGYPGMWIPALLYEPSNLSGKVPAVLNPNGHHAGGKFMDYKQARCINLAKRGMLALNSEFIGMAELRADAEHNRLGHLDLCGQAGMAVFYLAMKRGLDALLAHPHADPARIAMTGLSGGGWQTALLSALDPRVKVIVPVAGHSPVWQRATCTNDIGDLEQVPSDLCAVADFDELSGLFAPRPTLLIYNREDDCCFQTRRTRRSIYQPLKPVFAMYEAADKLGFHDNTDPGTHNYDSDNRSQLYQFLDKHFGVSTSNNDLPYQDELRSEAELTVGLPPDNATLLTLAHQALVDIRRQRQQRPRRTKAQARRQLHTLLKLPTYDQVKIRPVGKAQTRQGTTIRQHVLTLDQTWSLGITECAPPRSKGLALVIGDGGRGQTRDTVQTALAQGRRVLAVDLYGTGEWAQSWQYHMLLSTMGQRALGLQVGQLLAVVQWACRRHRTKDLYLHTQGQLMPIVGLLATALDPGHFNGLATTVLMASLDHLIEWPVPYANAAPLFCFGLLENFDIPDLIELADPVPIDDDNRGPLRS
ncbi:MAG: hypothetical protein GKR89_14410 [Candidatus Latescibacteria bacterium]|nr:hypothetical protein [Candidatus Latescibacterota bacterium]